MNHVIQSESQQNSNENQLDRYFHPVGLTALLYLREALHDEHYEECEQIIRTAREFGVYPWEITNMLKSI